jgi:hypothetical protein
MRVISDEELAGFGGAPADWVWACDAAENMKMHEPAMSDCFNMIDSLWVRNTGDSGCRPPHAGARNLTGSTGKSCYNTGVPQC